MKGHVVVEFVDSELNVIKELANDLPPKRSRSRQSFAFIGSLFLYLSFVVLAFVLFMFFGTNYINSRSQTTLLKQFSSQQHTSNYLAPPEGGVLAQIYIPKIDLNRIIVQGTAENDLIMAPGHYVSTPLPGQAGNVAIAGHRTTYGAPFYSLNKLSPGDMIDVSTAAGNFRYRVFRTLVVLPSDNSVLNPTTTPTLTLTTCNPLFSASTRLVVVAHLVGKPIGSSIGNRIIIEKKTRLRTTAEVPFSDIIYAIIAAIAGLLIGAYGILLTMRSRVQNRRIGFVLVALSFGLWIISFVLGGSLMPGSF